MKNKLLDSFSDKLIISNSHTVQPNVLLRTSVFTPSSTRKKIVEKSTQDVTQEFKRLELFKKEGYEYVVISGNELNVRTDFRIWCGVIMAFSKYGYDTNLIKMPLSEFIKMCGFSSGMLNKKFRERVQLSLKRIMDVNIEMGTKDKKKAVSTRLLSKFKYDQNKDEIMLIGDPELWELYTIDFHILLNLETIEAMPKAENAQCLYLFLASLPYDDSFITISRMRKRLASAGAKSDANKGIKAAIKKLEDIGYLRGHWIKARGEDVYMMAGREKKLPEKLRSADCVKDRKA